MSAKKRTFIKKTGDLTGIDQVLGNVLLKHNFNNELHFFALV